MGTPEFAVASLRRLVEEGYNIVGPHMRADRLSNFTACSRYEKWKVLR